MQTGWIKQWEEHKDVIQGRVCSPATAAGCRSAGRADASAVTLTVSESIPAGCLLTLNSWKVWLPRKCWSWDCYMTCLPGSWTDKVQAPWLSSLFLSSSQSMRETLSSLVLGCDSSKFLVASGWSLCEPVFYTILDLHSDLQPWLCILILMFLLGAIWFVPCLCQRLLDSMVWIPHLIWCLSVCCQAKQEPLGGNSH